MNEKERQLLINDLCARLPYGVVVSSMNNEKIAVGRLSAVAFDEAGVAVEVGGYEGSVFSLEKTVPYLRPMESMDPAEREEYNAIYRCQCHEGSVKRFTELCYKGHLDCNGLIPKGLAIPAVDGMYAKPVISVGDDVYIDCFDGSRIRVTVTEIGEGIIVGVDAEGKSHWGNPKDVTKITEQ